MKIVIITGRDCGSGVVDQKYNSTFVYILKDFIVTMDVLTCKTTNEKFRWAFSLYDQKKSGGINFYGLKKVLILLEEVEYNGFMDTPTQEELDEINYRRTAKFEPLKLAEDRAKDIWTKLELPVEGDLTAEDINRVPMKFVFARD